MVNDLAVSLGRAARQARTALGFTQANMAEQLDVSVEFYGRMERGVALPSIETFRCRVEILDVPADILLDIETLRTKMAASSTGTAPAEPPELRELLPMLREAGPGTLRIVRLLLDVIEQGPATRKRTRGRGTRKSPPDDE
jgi:transcriptional regulator with XRE-family HTH domain